MTEDQSKPAEEATDLSPDVPHDVPASPDAVAQVRRRMAALVGARVERRPFGEFERD